MANLSKKNVYIVVRAPDGREYTAYYRWSQGPRTGELAFVHADGLVYEAEGEWWVEQFSAAQFAQFTREGEMISTGFWEEVSVSKGTPNKPVSHCSYEQWLYERELSQGRGKLIFRGPRYERFAHLLRLLAHKFQVRILTDLCHECGAGLVYSICLSEK